MFTCHSLPPDFQNMSSMEEILARLSAVEKRLEQIETKKASEASTNSAKRKKTGRVKVDASIRKLNDIKEKSKQFYKERDILIKFNDAQLRRKRMKDPSDPVITWTNKNGVKFDMVRDTVSLLALSQSDVKPVRTGNFTRKFPVIIKDGRLVPLCSDFKDGLGVSYAWTKDEDIPPPSKVWKYDYKNKRSKSASDPRVGVLDPTTGEVWKPDIVESDMMDESATQEPVSKESSDQEAESQKPVAKEAVVKESSVQKHESQEPISQESSVQKHESQEPISQESGVQKHESQEPISQESSVEESGGEECEFSDTEAGDNDVEQDCEFSDNSDSDSDSNDSENRKHKRARNEF